MARRAAMICAVLTLAVGCEPSEPVQTAALPVKSAASPIRYDSPSLEQAFPKLPRPVVGEWVEGILGSEVVPGPGTTFWVDAIVELPPAQLEAFTAPYKAGMNLVVRPELYASLDRDVPTGTYNHSDNLDKAMSTTGWTVKMYVPTDASVIVFQAQGKPRLP